MPPIFTISRPRLLARALRTVASAGQEAHQPSFSNFPHPAIAQREVLRQFYSSYTTPEQLAIVKASTDLLDKETSLSLMCHAADMSIKGQLEGTLGEQDELMYAIYQTLDPQVPSMRPTEIGALLWSLCSVPGARSEWTDTLLEQVATKEMMIINDRVASYSTREMANILCAAGKLCRQSTHAVFEYAVALAGALEKSMSFPYVRGAFSASDFADLTDACASICEGAEETPEEVAALLDVVSGEVRRQLANKHSGRATFTPRELSRFLSAYSRLRHYTLHTSSMLDAVAGFVSARSKARHLNAVARPSDIAGMLRAFAELEHRSVAVPELLTALGEQLRRNAAQLQERESSSGGGAGGHSSGNSGAPDMSCSIAQLVDILESHETLGYCPNDIMMQAAIPGVRRALPMSCAEDVVKLVRLLDTFQFNAGPSTLTLLVAHIIEDGGMRIGKEELEETLDIARKLGADVDSLSSNTDY